jgi:hypothetical protein
LELHDARHFGAKVPVAELTDARKNLVIIAQSCIDL